MVWLEIEDGVCPDLELSETAGVNKGELLTTSRHLWVSRIPEIHTCLRTSEL